MINNSFLRKNIFFLLLIIIGTIPCNAQIFWASKLLSYSSQKDGEAYSAAEVLGPPSKLPALGDCGCAWTPSMANNYDEEFIRVAFDKRIKVRQILVSENFNAGAIKYIYLYDIYNIPHLVYERTAVAAEYGRLFTILIPQTEFESGDLKLVLDTESVPGYNQIDAIGISETEEIYKQPSIQITNRIEFKGDPIKMGNGINSFGSDIAPLISPDGSRLYYTRKDHPGNTGTVMNDDIWYSDKIGNKWTAPINIGAPLNNEGSNTVVGILDNGNMLSLANTYNLDGSSEAGIAQTWRKKDSVGWKYPVNLVTPGIRTNNLYGEFYMNTEGTVLVMSLEKGEGYGLKDIYVSFSSNMIFWSVPKNLGKAINTVASEMAPFLAPDGRTLFFASDGRPGYGEQDIYVSYRLDDSWTKWTSPENLGPKINSDGFDAYFSFSDSSYYAYFTSTRDEYFNPDIYQIPIKDIPEIIEDTLQVQEIVVSIDDSLETEEEESELNVDLVNDYLLFGTIFDSRTELPIDAKLIFQLDAYIDQPDSIQTLNKNYQKKITGNVSYKVIVLKEGYLYHEETVEITDFNTQKVKRIDFRLEPITKGESFILSDLFFDANSARIKQVSIEQLNTLYNFLITNKTLNIEIGGHTNGLCDDAFCNSLSQLRADAVLKYLVDKGIDASRLSAKGYGKAKPITSDDTAEGRKKNQRVEITIL